MTLHEFLVACRAGEVTPLLTRPLDDPHNLGDLILLVRDEETRPYFESGLVLNLAAIAPLVALHTVYACINPEEHRSSWYCHQLAALGCIPCCARCRVVREAIAAELWRREHD